MSITNAKSSMIYIASTEDDRTGIAWKKGDIVLCEDTFKVYYYTGSVFRLLGGAFGNIIKTPVTIDFPNTGAGTTADVDVTVTGAAVGDAVLLVAPDGQWVDGAMYSARVASADHVNVRIANVKLLAGINPDSASYAIVVIKP